MGDPNTDKQGSGSGMKRTACKHRNLIECDECGDTIGDGDLKRTVHWSYWNKELQNFNRRARQEHYCEGCWREEFQRDAAAYYEVTNASQLWGILAAANGTLVADLRPCFVGGRPWIRVVDDQLQAMNTTVVGSHERDGERVIEFGTEEVDVGRDWFMDVFPDNEESTNGDSNSSGRPTIVLLKPANETPFDEWEEPPDDQQTLDEVSD